MTPGVKLETGRFFCLLVLAGCAALPPDEFIDDKTVHEALPRPSPEGREELPAQGTRPENESARGASGARSFAPPAAHSADRDPFDDLRSLWEAGRTDAARIRFHRPDIRALSRGVRRDEWLLWRGRLFLSHIRAADFGLAGENISALLVDRDDLWAGTWTGGAARRSLPLETSRTFDPGRPSQALRTVNRFRRIPAGIAVVRYGAVELYDTRSGLWESWSGLPADERLQDILHSRDRIYLATLGSGLWVSERAGARAGEWRRVNEPGAFITRLEEASGNRILIATMDRGVFIYDPSDDSWRRPPDTRLQRANVTSIMEYDGLCIGGTYGEGAFAWDIRGDGITRFGEERLGDSYVLAAAELDGRIFFGTFGGGVRVWNPETDEWDALSLADGLLSADAASLAAGAGGIWAGTLQGGVVGIDRGIYSHED